MNTYFFPFIPLLLSNTVMMTTAAQKKQPNILFCIADDAGHMSAYGTSWVNTPAFDKVAREGLLFEQAFTCNAKSAPSRAAIITGRNSWQLKEACNHWPVFPYEFKSYPEALSDNGYYVGYTGKDGDQVLPMISEAIKETLQVNHGTEKNWFPLLRKFQM